MLKVKLIIVLIYLDIGDSLILICFLRVLSLCVCEQVDQQVDHQASRKIRRREKMEDYEDQDLVSLTFHYLLIVLAEESCLNT